MLVINTPAGVTITSIDNHFSAFTPVVRKFGPGTVTQMIAVGGAWHWVNEGNIENFYNFFGAPIRQHGGTGTVTNAYGLYLHGLKQPFVTNAYGVYQAGSSDINYFAGNVGVGTTMPGARLEVFNTAASGHLILSANNNPAADSTRVDIDFKVANTGHTVGRIASYYTNSLGGGYGGLRFYTRNAGILGEVMRLTPDGNVGIGTTSPSHRLHVMGDVFATGVVYCNSTALCSDQRWKTNIKAIQNALDNVLKMQGVTYHWKVDEYPDKHFPEGEQVGFIAQEIEKVYPQVVHTDKDGYKSVDYSKLTPILVEAIKEQQKIIEELQKVIQHLQEENSQIKQANAQLSVEIKMLNEKVDNLINSLSNDKKLSYR
jgi:hypothetical protein